MLKLLATPYGTLLLCGGSQWSSFYDLSLKDREKALLRMANSRIPQIRFLFTSFMAISMFTTYGKALKINNQQYNPIWKVLSYPGPHPERPIPLAHDIWKPNFIQYNQINQKDSFNRRLLNCDIVIIGSGAGGGVVAAELAKEGYHVILLEKAKYMHPTDLPLTEMSSFDLLYERKGTLMSEDGGLRILAGNAFGGGTFVNWSACLETPQKVRAEWAEKHKLPHFVSADFQKSIDAVSKRIGVSSNAIKHNPSNQILIDGCKKLGYPVRDIPQNTGGKEHSCGWCTFGCPYNEKLGSLPTWIKDASDAGCQLIDNCFVKQVIHKNGVATGVLCLIDEKELVISAKRIVVSCGSIQTPSLLLRSGLTNRNIGRNLRLHPVTTVSGIFDHRVSPYRGSIMTALSEVVADRDGSGYGARLEVPAIHPSMLATLLPWTSGKEHKRLMTQFDHTATFIVLTRDKDSAGRVYIDKNGESRIDWKLSAYDAQSILEGLVAGIKVMIAAGAKEVITLQHGVPTFKVPEKNPLESKEFKDYIQKVKSAGIVKLYTSLFCAHQMGSCRMGANSSEGAVRSTGESWEVKNLFVADASLFPTSSGANPMLTTFSIAYSVAQFLKENLKQDRSIPRRSSKL